MSKKTHFGHFKQALIEALLVRAINECHKDWVAKGWVKGPAKKAA